MPHDGFFESQTGHNEFSALRPEEPVIGPLMTKLKKLWELRDSAVWDPAAEAAMVEQIQEQGKKSMRRHATTHGFSGTPEELALDPFLFASYLSASPSH